MLINHTERVFLRENKNQHVCARDDSVLIHPQHMLTVCFSCFPSLSFSDRTRLDPQKEVGAINRKWKDWVCVMS